MHGGRGRADGGGPRRAGSVVRGLSHSDKVHVSGRKDPLNPTESLTGPSRIGRQGDPFLGTRTPGCGRWEPCLVPA